MSRFKHWLSEGTLLAPAALLLTLFVIIPFVLSGYLAFTNERLIPSPLPVQWVGLRNYSRVLTDPYFWQAVRNTFYFALMVVPFQCALALGAAILLNRKLVGLTFFRSVAMLPLLTPITVIIAIWAALYQVPNGFFNSLVDLFSDDTGSVNFLGSKELAMPAIVLLSAWASFPFQMLIYLAGLQEIPEDRYEAATLEGANGWQKFKAVTWPGLRNVNIFILIITTVQAFKLFTQVHILTKGGPLGSTSTIITYMFENGYSEGRIGFASAVSVIFFVLVAMIAIFQRVVFKND